VASRRIPDAAAADWWSSLPKVLWQIQDSDPRASLVILKVLKHQGIRMAASSVPADRDGFELLQKALVPFFYTEVKDSRSGTSRTVFGPFVSVPSTVQRAGAPFRFVSREASNMGTYS
jgi:hypothetical protein